MVAEEQIRHYLSLPYQISVTFQEGDESRPWLASVEELTGCEARGATAAEAVAQIPAALAEWVAGAHASGREIPEPNDVHQYSGKLLVRMPKSLHRKLARAAERDQVSLNAYMNGVLAAAAGWLQAPGAETETGAGAGADRDWARRQRLIMIAIIVNSALLVLATIVGLVLLVT
jgi:predicted RNase H-like HicB family nuclease